MQKVQGAPDLRVRRHAPQCHLPSRRRSSQDPARALALLADSPPTRAGPANHPAGGRRFQKSRGSAGTAFQRSMRSTCPAAPERTLFSNEAHARDQEEQTIPDGRDERPRGNLYERKRWSLNSYSYRRISMHALLGGVNAFVVIIHRAMKRQRHNAILELVRSGEIA